MSQYDAIAQRFLAKCQQRGGAVTFRGTGGTAPTQDPTTGAWTGGSAGTDASGWAVQDVGNPETLAALDLILVNSVTLLIAAWGLTVVPVPGMMITWAGKSYTLKSANPYGPDGVPIYFPVIGAA